MGIHRLLSVDGFQFQQFLFRRDLLVKVLTGIKNEKYEKEIILLQGFVLGTNRI
jgi:hypothetical protein